MHDEKKLRRKRNKSRTILLFLLAPMSCQDPDSTFEKL